jgi:Helix-turn-helix domain
MHHNPLQALIMSYTLKQAADATGRSKSTIFRAIESGRLSAQRNEHGQWMVDPAELRRVYAPLSDAGIDSDATPSGENALMRELLTERNKRIASLETMVESLEGVISDLMMRLDREADDRRRITAQLTGLLTDESTRKGGWLRKWFA